jgi:hypothetical protein
MCNIWLDYYLSGSSSRMCSKTSDGSQQTAGINIDRANSAVQFNRLHTDTRGEDDMH